MRINLQSSLGNSRQADYGQSCAIFTNAIAPVWSSFSNCTSFSLRWVKGPFLTKKQFISGRNRKSKLAFNSSRATLLTTRLVALFAGISKLRRWVRGLISSPDARPMWLSTYQLLASFQSFTGRTGVKFIRKGNKWEWQDRHVDATDFIRSLGWLQSILRNYANTFGFSFFAENHIPEGPTFRAWTRSICVTASPASFFMIDAESGRRGVCNVRKIHSQLGGLGPFSLAFP